MCRVETFGIAALRSLDLTLLLKDMFHNMATERDIEQSLPHSSTLTQPPAEYMDLKEVSKDNRQQQNTSPGADDAPLHPLTRSWEVPRHHVTIEKVIGKGAFGQVAKGTVVGLRGRPDTTTAAIKMLKSNATESDKKDLKNLKQCRTLNQILTT
ncbi:Fibroblast growth factor receptor [Stylophora pistillata]|uniref:Fibroblast growth factor receptor n=1 Tax=Stylophora pistillata TaxID=50429 RepID=A0A2B4R7I2_STYPI|nr:Fibroblast growth factor receptor [Stylophora pistillata]